MGDENDDDDRINTKKEIFSEKDVLGANDFGLPPAQDLDRITLIKQRIEAEEFSKLSPEDIYETLECEKTSEGVEGIADNHVVQDYLRKKIKYITRDTAKKIIEKLITGFFDMKLEEINPKCAKILKHNRAMFEVDSMTQHHVFRQDVIKKIAAELFVFINDIIRRLEEIDSDETQSSVCKIDKHTTYEKIYKNLCDEGIHTKFTYDFDTPDLPITSLDLNVYTVQRCKIKTSSENISFGIPLRYQYHCFQCGKTISGVKAYDVRNQKESILCDGFKLDSKGQKKPCGKSLYPESNLTENFLLHHHDAISYKNTEGTIGYIEGVSLDKLGVGEYDAIVVIFHMKNTHCMLVLATRKMESKTIEIVEKEAENTLQSNRIFSLIDSFDRFVHAQTNHNIVALYPVKAAFVLQACASYMKKFDHKFNIQLIGSKSVGKSMMTKYYGHLLYGDRNMMTRASDISVPGLRGTRTVLKIFGKDISYISPGALSKFRAINIDEISLNTQGLIENMKNFLCDESYSYNKAGDIGLSFNRTAHVNITENLSVKHLGEYNGKIRKSYREMTATIGTDTKENWDEEWDLHRPLSEYTNPYLYKAVKDTREYFFKKNLSWIDGYDNALHDRFPLYFFLVNETNDSFEISYDEILFDDEEGSESSNSFIANALRNRTVEEYFKECYQYRLPKEKIDAKKIDEIYMEYEMSPDIRTKKFYRDIIKLSRILNKRLEYNDSDYDLLRYIIENTNRKLDIMDTKEISLKRDRKPKEIEKKTIFSQYSDRKKMLDMVDKIKNTDDAFGLPEGEF